MKQIWKISLAAFVVLALLFSIGIAKDGKYAWLGVSTQTVDDELAEAFELSVEYGTIINEIIPDSPADKAGLEEGDIIIMFNDDKVWDYDDLIDNLEDYGPKDDVVLTIMRDDDKLTVDVTLGGTSKSKDKYNSRYFGRVPAVTGVPSVPSVPSAPRVFAFDDDGNNIYGYKFGSDSYIGVQLTDMSDQLRKYFGADDDIGVLVSEVEKDTPAEEAGIKAGDVIVKADDEDVYSYKDLKYVIEDKDEGDKVLITVLRDRNEESFEVTVDERTDRNAFYFNGPDVNIRIPSARGYHYSDDLHEFFGSGEFEDIMEELAEELKELEEMKFEYKNSSKDNFIEKDVMKDIRKELEQARKEIKKLNLEDNKEYKKELEELRKEIKRLEKKIDD